MQFCPNMTIVSTVPYEMWCGDDTLLSHADIKLSSTLRKRRKEESCRWSHRHTHIEVHRYTVCTPEAPRGQEVAGEDWTKATSHPSSLNTGKMMRSIPSRASGSSLMPLAKSVWCL